MGGGIGDGMDTMGTMCGMGCMGSFRWVGWGGSIADQLDISGKGVGVGGRDGRDEWYGWYGGGSAWDGGGTAYGIGEVCGRTGGEHSEGGTVQLTSVVKKKEPKPQVDLYHLHTDNTCINTSRTILRTRVNGTRIQL
jgi:hypothetical protein